MDGGILMDGEVSIGGDAEGDAMKASVNGRCQQQGRSQTLPDGRAHNFSQHKAHSIYSLY